MLKSLFPCPVASTGVRGREKSTGAVRGALAYPPVKAVANALLRGVDAWAELLCDGRVRYWFRRSRPGGKADDDARNRDIADGDDCCSVADVLCDVV